MSKPTVLFINRVYPQAREQKGRAATGRLLKDMARSFVRAGWDVQILTTGETPGLERDGPMRITRIKAPDKPQGAFAYGWIWLRLLIKGLFSKPADIVITMTDPPLLVVAGNWIARFKDAKHIHWCQDLYPDLFPVLGFKFSGPAMRLMKAMTFKAMNNADRIIAIGRCMGEALRKQGVAAAQITIVPNWPDLQLVSDRPSPPMKDKPLPPGAKAIEDLLTDQPKFRVLYAGTIGLAHPLDTVLDAAKLLHDTQPDIEFVFVGGGKGFDALAEERGKRGLENIRLIPFQPASRLKDLMESGDVHLITMKDDAAGMMVPSKLYAALAVARPCIFLGPQDCEAATVIEDFGAGMVLPQGNAEKLAAAIKKYRMESDEWFAAHEGAGEAGSIFKPKESIRVFVERAVSVWESI